MTEEMQKRVYSFSNEIGDARMTVLDVFPGIQLIYHSAHMDRFELSEVVRGSLIEIHHCREGRIEQNFDGAYFCLMPGDLSIAMRRRTAEAYEFPLRHYHGVSLVINADLAPENLSRLLSGVQVRPMEIAKRLCRERSYYILRARKDIDHIFTELYAVPEHILPGYLKVKTLELMLALSELEPGWGEAKEYALSCTQVQLAKLAAKYLEDSGVEQAGTAQLAQIFDVSEAWLNKAFIGMYGVPVEAFGRIRRMQAAAQLLIHTDQPIMEIAAEAGYGNQGRFSTAFRELMGASPRDFRKAHSKQRRMREEAKGTDWGSLAMI